MGGGVRNQVKNASRAPIFITAQISEISSVRATISLFSAMAPIVSSASVSLEDQRAVDLGAVCGPGDLAEGRLKDPICPMG